MNWPKFDLILGWRVRVEGKGNAFSGTCWFDCRTRVDRSRENYGAREGWWGGENRFTFLYSVRNVGHTQIPTGSGSTMFGTTCFAGNWITSIQNDQSVTIHRLARIILIQHIYITRLDSSGPFSFFWKHLFLSFWYSENKCDPNGRAKEIWERKNVFNSFWNYANVNFRV